ncbi:MAG: NUDIX hydrolase [Candidatus Puniceispirillum sp.]|nr:NUDIX hydrolase [Candidatus Puniceispirillum sp.]
MDHKIGVIPFDISGGRVSIMFVTSQRRGRWIFPKGNLKPDESHKKGCKREAFEEAGVEGRIISELPMTHVVTKSSNGKLSEVAVTYYPMLVSKQFDKWPEQAKRERQWALLEDAGLVADCKDFQQVIKQFAAIKPLILETAKRKKP